MGFYIATFVVFFLCFCCCMFLDEKRKDLKREVESLYDVLSRQNDRIADMDSRFRELRNDFKLQDAQEKKLFEGMNNILNYDISQAMRAAQGVKDYAEDE